MRGGSTRLPTCFACHGEKKQKGRLRLDSLAGALPGAAVTTRVGWSSAPAFQRLPLELTLVNHLPGYAFRAVDGSPVWRFNTVPQRGEPGFEEHQHAVARDARVEGQSGLVADAPAPQEPRAPRKARRG